MKNKPVISFKDFSFQYYSQSEPTLKNINLDIYPGEKVLIAGPSGSGKSTLGACLNGLIPFSYKGKITGSLKINDLETSTQDIFSLSKVVGTVLQDPDAQFIGLTVAEDIAFALENDCISYEDMHSRVEDTAKLVQMDTLLDSSPYQLSGGQKQRTALAGVMIDNVDVLLFDEPLANLDPATGKNAIGIIDQIHETTKKTIIIIEHRIEDVLYKKVDRVIVMNEGCIVADMSVNELLCSSVLADEGIREPLYITAVKYAGVKIEPGMHPAYIDTLDINQVKDSIKRWYASSESHPYESNHNIAISVENLCFSYDKSRKILDNVSFEINKGDMVSIVGKNGAGKSTLSKLLCGFETEQSGKILFEGQDIKEKSIKERAEFIGFVMQNPNQMISKTMIFDEVALGLKLRGVPENQINEKVQNVLKICGLYEFRSWPISALSFGQKKRVTIASILALDPEVIILDEPTAGQDYKHYTEIMEFLCKLNESGITIIIITHDMHLMLEYTKRTIVIADGKKIADSIPSVVLTDRDIIERASLKETSLYTLANLCGIEDGAKFVQNFIDYERGAQK